MMTIFLFLCQVLYPNSNRRFAAFSWTVDVRKGSRPEDSCCPFAVLLLSAIPESFALHGSIWEWPGLPGGHPLHPYVVPTDQADVALLFQIWAHKLIQLSGFPQSSSFMHCWFATGWSRCTSQPRSAECRASGGFAKLRLASRGRWPGVDQDFCQRWAWDASPQAEARLQPNLCACQQGRPVKRNHHQHWPSHQHPHPALVGSKVPLPILRTLFLFSLPHQFIWS